jgi:hypothetical protein
MPVEVQKTIEEAEAAGAATEAFEAKVEELLDTLAFNNITGAVHYLDRQSAIWNHVGKTTAKGRFAACRQAQRRSH